MFLVVWLFDDLELCKYIEGLVLFVVKSGFCFEEILKEK